MESHGKNLRKGRCSQPGGMYLLTWATDRRNPWFADWVLGRLVVMSLRRVHDRGDVESLAFVVMPDHVHWLIRLGDRLLQNLMQDVKSYSGFHVKQSIQRHSEAIPVAIWQKSYHDHALQGRKCSRCSALYRDESGACRHRQIST